MRKVIAFDSWAQYAHHFEDLVDSLGERELEIILIHVGSWGHDPGKPKQETRGSLTIRDISFYKGMSFLDILQTESPCAVLFLSLQPFAHRAFNRYCQFLQIPTVHLYHGIVQVQDLTVERMFKLNVASHLQRIASRIWTNLVNIWPAYLASLWRTRASSHEWFYFPYTVWRQLVGLSYSGDAPPDAKTDACCVYTQIDVIHAAKRYGLSPEKIFPVGNPDLARFGVNEADLGAMSDLAVAANNTRVMYIDTGFIDIGLIFSGLEEFVEHILKTRDTLKRQGFDFVIKLHPAHFRTGAAQALVEKGVETCDNENFLLHLKDCAACITEPSSLAVIPGLLGLPVFLAKYGLLESLTYGEVLTSYPRSTLLPDLDEFGVLLSDTQANADPYMLEAWISDNAGPLPSEAIPDRIANVISSVSMTNQSSSQGL